MLLFSGMTNHRLCDFQIENKGHLSKFIISVDFKFTMNDVCCTWNKFQKYTTQNRLSYISAGVSTIVVMLGYHLLPRYHVTLLKILSTYTTMSYFSYNFNRYIYIFIQYGYVRYLIFENQFKSARILFLEPLMHLN